MSPLHVLTFDLSTFILDCENYGLSVGLFSLASVTSVEQLNIDQVFFHQFIKVSGVLYLRC